MRKLKHATTKRVKHAKPSLSENGSMATIGARIKARREELKLSVAKVAAAAGVTPSAVYQWESGETEGPSRESLIGLAIVLKTYERWLVFEKGPKDRGNKEALDPDEYALIMTYRELEPGLKLTVALLATNLLKQQGDGKKSGEGQ